MQMSNYLPDGRVPKTGAIQLGDNRYTITRCVAGGNSLCYFVSNETGTHYVIKEFYPSRYAYREESTGKICSIPGYEPVYDELKKRFRNENEYVNKASAETYQVGSYFEQFYDQEGYALMRRHSKDLHSLSALIQEFCDNKQGSMDRLNAAIEIMISLLSALEKLHDTIHIIHFDLSLSNVLYSQSNGQYHASLMDFGSARKCDNGVVSIDQKLDIPGSTQEFGAPELAFSKQLTTAADIYSAGIIFYHLITSGIGCYSGRAIPPAEVLSRGGNLEMQYGIDCLDIYRE
jgi:serine/threonine protein kinase